MGWRRETHHGITIQLTLTAAAQTGQFQEPGPPEPDLPGFDQPGMAGLLDNLTGEDHGTLRRMVDGARHEIR